MNKIFNFIKHNGTKTILGCLAVFTISSCDPTIDALSFDLAEENSKEDLTGPTASFSFFEGFNEETNEVLVTFSNSSSNASMFNWDFGNGQTSDEREFTAAYDNPDSGTVTYFITLEASDNLGVTNSITDSITVGEVFFREPQLIDDYTLINTGDSADPVVIFDFSSEQGDDFSRTNYASNILDKDGGDGGVTTLWTSNDDLPATGGTGDGNGDGEYIIFDLGADYELGLIRFKTDSRTRLYGYQILASTTGTSDSDFSFLIPESATSFDSVDWGFTESANVDWQYKVLEIPTTARYIKLIAYGRYSATDESDFRLWSNWAEIEFFSTKQ